MNYYHERGIAIVLLVLPGLNKNEIFRSVQYVESISLESGKKDDTLKRSRRLSKEGDTQSQKRGRYAKTLSAAIKRERYTQQEAGTQLWRNIFRLVAPPSSIGSGPPI